MTNPQANQWGIGAGAPAYGLVNGRGDCPQLAMFGAPNNWSVDGAGNFTKDFETDQFKAALGYVRDLYAAGVFYPDPVTLNSTILKTSFEGGKIGVISTGWASYAAEFWDAGLKLNPPVKYRAIAPFRRCKRSTSGFLGTSGQAGWWRRVQARWRRRRQADRLRQSTNVGAARAGEVRSTRSASTTGR
jgi:hypothetical protein